MARCFIARCQWELLPQFVKLWLIVKTASGYQYKGNDINQNTKTQQKGPSSHLSSKSNGKICLLPPEGCFVGAGVCPVWKMTSGRGGEAACAGLSQVLHRSGKNGIPVS